MAASLSDSTTNPVAGIIDNGNVSVQQVLVVVLCMFFNLLDGFDITAMAVVASSVSRELGLTPDLLGWIFSAALAGMMTGAMLLAPVSDVIGRRKLIIFCLSLVGVSILLTANATSLVEFMSLRFVSGVGAGAMLACQATLASEYSPEKYRAFSVAAVTTGYPTGAILTAVFAGSIMPEFGWRGMFWFGGSVTVVMVLVAWIFIPESLKYLVEKRPVGALEKVNHILGKLKKERLTALPERPGHATNAKSGLLASIRNLLAPQYRSATLILWAAFFMSFCTMYFLMSWIPKLMEDSGYAQALGRQAFFLCNLGGVLGTILMGYLSTRFSLSGIILSWLAAAAAGMVLFGLLAHQPQALMPIIFIVGGLSQGGFTGLYCAAAKVYPTQMRSTGIGWAIGLGRSGAVVGPAAAGYFIAAGLDMSANFYIFAVPLLISGLIGYRLNIR